MTAVEWASLMVLVVIGGLNIWVGVKAKVAFDVFEARVATMDKTVKLAIEVVEEAKGEARPASLARLRAIAAAEQGRKG